MAYPFLLLTLLALYIRPGDLNPNFASIPLLTIVSALLAITLALSWFAKTSQPRWAPHLTWLIGTWFGFVFSHIANTYFGMAVSTLTGFFTNVFLGIAMVFVLNSRKRLTGFATVWIWAAVFLAVGGIVQNVTGIGWGGQTLYKGRIQGVGIFSDPNDLALTFLIAVPLARARYFKRGVISRVLFAGLVLLFTYATFLTNSRGGMLALLLIFFLFSAHRFGPKVGVVIGGLLVVGFLAIAPSRLHEVDSKEASAQGRIAAWSEGLQMFKKNPLAGVGYGRFTDYHEITAHNSFVLAFAETGLVGSYFWVGLLYVSLLGLRRLKIAVTAVPVDSWVDTWAKDTRIAFIAFLAGLFFLSRTYNPLLYLLVGFSAALWRVGLDTHPDADFKLSTKDKFSIFGLVIAGIVLTYGMVKTLAIWTGRFI